MLPLAASTGLAIAGGVILVALVFLWWLLRAETRDEAALVEQEVVQAEQEAAREAERDPAGTGPPADGRPT